jgi:hypothetical protein
MIDETTEKRIVVENIVDEKTLFKEGNVLTKQKIWTDTEYELINYLSSIEFFNNILDEYTMMEDLAGNIHIVKETFEDAWKTYRDDEEDKKDYTPEELSLLNLISSSPEGSLIHIYF